MKDLENQVPVEQVVSVEQQKLKFIQKENKLDDIFGHLNWAGKARLQIDYNNNLIRLMSQPRGIDRPKSYNPAMDTIELGGSQGLQFGPMIIKEKEKKEIIIEKKSWFRRFIDWICK